MEIVSAATTSKLPAGCGSTRFGPARGAKGRACGQPKLAGTYGGPRTSLPTIPQPACVMSTPASAKAITRTISETRAARTRMIQGNSDDQRTEVIVFGAFDMEALR